MELNHRRKDMSGAAILCKRFALPGLRSRLTLAAADARLARRIRKAQRGDLPIVLRRGAVRAAALALACRLFTTSPDNGWRSASAH